MSESKPYRVSRKIAQPRLGIEPATSVFLECSLVFVNCDVIIKRVYSQVLSSNLKLSKNVRHKLFDLPIHLYCCMNTFFACKTGFMFPFNESLSSRNSLVYIIVYTVLFYGGLRVYCMYRCKLLPFANKL